MNNNNNNSSEIQTRSQTSKGGEPRWTQIPAAVKIYKLIINELDHLVEEKEAEAAEGGGGGSGGGGGEEGEEEEWEDDDEDEEDGGVVLSDLLASGDSGLLIMRF